MAVGAFGDFVESFRGGLGGLGGEVVVGAGGPDNAPVIFCTVG